MQVQSPKLSGQPRMDVGQNACQVSQKDAANPRQLAVAEPNLGKTRKSVSIIEAVQTQAEQKSKGEAIWLEDATGWTLTWTG